MSADPHGGPAAVLDDIDARPGSTASLLRTVVGLYLRRIGGWISAADLVSLAEDLGIPSGPARTGIARLKQRGLLRPERTTGIGYRLEEGAVPMLERGDRRIFAVRQMQDDDPWCLISFSIPETRRDLRHRLRRQLQFLGCGVVSSALWICPWHLHDEAEGILSALGARAHATLFRTATPEVSGSLADAAAAWWDLGSLRAEHLAFQASVSTLPAEPFAAYVRLIDSWRVLPYIDPGLPPGMLPDDWPGRESVDAFTRLSAQLGGPAWDHVRLRVGLSSPARL